MTDDGCDGQITERMIVGIRLQVEIENTCGAVSFHFDFGRLLGGVGATIESFLRLIPCGDFGAVDGNDFVAGLEACVGSGGIRRHVGDDGGLVEVSGVRLAGNHVVAGEKQDREDQIHGGSGERDDGTLPALLGHEFVGSARGLGIARINFGDVLSRHADVAAERQRADAPIGVAALDTEKARTETDGEDIDADAEETCSDEMAPFMDKDNDAQG